MHGYHGRALVIDLTTGASRYDALDDATLRAFVGGGGLGSYLLYRYCPQGADPLGPWNPLIFVTSPLIGTGLTTTSKFAVVAKSPLTGFIGDSLSSSYLAPELKKLGADAVVILGQAARWSVLCIDDGAVTVRDAAHLLGQDTFETEAAVKRELGPKVRVACIGPAGERLVRYASIATDGGRQAGRTGIGAVMGSKRLKAIAVHGTQRVTLAAPEAIESYAVDLRARSLGQATEKYRVLGTMANVASFNRLGALPTRNFQQATFEQAAAVSGETLHRTHAPKDAHCANCTIGCEKVLTTSDGGAKTSARMEYESLFALGPLCGVGDPNVVVRAARACDALGLDTISTGVTIAWAMECAQRGLLTPQDAGGMRLRFGDGDALLAAIELIARRGEGLGDLLAEGTRQASARVGEGSEAWAMHVKGLEMPGYEPRSLQTMALGLAVSTRGACHNRSSAYEADFSAEVDRLRADDRRGAIAMRTEDFSAVLDSMIWCKFLRKAFTDFWGESARAYEMVTGVPTAPDDLRRAGERINNVKKLFNIREGWTRADDTLPARALEEPLRDGVAAGVRLTRGDLDMMIGSYYHARGWTEEGMVPEGKIGEMGLEGLLAQPSSDRMR